MNDLPGDHFDYNTVPISVGVLVSKQNAFFLERIELEETLRKVQSEIQRSDDACADLRKAIERLGFVWTASGGLIFKCEAGSPTVVDSPSYSQEVAATAVETTEGDCDV